MKKEKQIYCYYDLALVVRARLRLTHNFRRSQAHIRYICRILFYPDNFRSYYSSCIIFQITLLRPVSIQQCRYSIITLSSPG